MTGEDAEHMRAALALARRGLGQTWPNPAVGCVIVKQDRVVGRAVTAPGGRPHAETQALAMAGAEARGATAYVTLEPCSHHGGTPPCADALATAGVARVVVALADPDPRVNGGGLSRLRDAGIVVQTGLLTDEAADVAAGFLTRVRHGRPMVTLKLASTLDGRIATASGESRWITGAEARHAVHAMRARHDAVLVGIGTVLADDPDLTCRIEGMRRMPLLRIVADRDLRLPLGSRLVATARDAPVWVLAGPDAPAKPAEALMAAGVRIIQQDGLLAPLGRAGLTRVLMEGGAGIAAALLAAGEVDRIAWFHAPALLGADAHPALGAMQIGALRQAPRFLRRGSVPYGPDMLTEFTRL